MLSAVRASLASATASAWRANCAPVQWLARLSAILSAASTPIARDVQQTLLAECVICGAVALL
jgi:hypothetical protein